ncbi:hypothetical protein GJU89_04075 [Brucella sp. 09RB8918]|nr:hypothetical protein [Brucella sp. 09RB8918]
MEMLYLLSGRIIQRKTASHFCWKCSNSLFLRIIQRKTASHFCWKCSSRARAALQPYGSR